MFGLDDTDIYAENSLIENIQVILLAIASIAYLLPIMIEKRSDNLVFLFCSLLCYSFVLRELDLEKLDVPAALKLIGPGASRNALIGVALIAIFSYAGVHLSHYKGVVRKFLKSRQGILTAVGGGFFTSWRFF